MLDGNHIYKNKKKTKKEPHPLNHILEQPLGIPTALRIRLSPKVNQIPSVIVTITEDRSLGIVQQWQDLVKIALLPLGRQLEVEPPQSAAEESPPSV